MSLEWMDVVTPEESDLTLRIHTDGKALSFRLSNKLWDRVSGGGSLKRAQVQYATVKNSAYARIVPTEEGAWKVQRNGTAGYRIAAPALLPEKEYSSEVCEAKIDNEGGVSSLIISLPAGFELKDKTKVRANPKAKAA